MADCTKTVDFLREWKRMCKNHNCNDCPLGNKKHVSTLCRWYVIDECDNAIAIVQKWSDEHPVMTWEGKLKELLPNVDMSKIIGTCCPYNLLGGKAPNVETCRSALECIYCWNGEYKEES